MAMKSGDTAHLYDGKTVRSSAPSRKKLAGNASATGEIPKDAIPTVEIPSFIESLLGGPLVPKMKFLPPDKMVQNLQFAVYGVLVALALLTFMISPPEGTIWYIITGSLGVANLFQLSLSLAQPFQVLWAHTSVMHVFLSPATFSLFLQFSVLPPRKHLCRTISSASRTIPGRLQSWS